VKFAFIAAEKVTYPVEMLCTVLEVSRSGYYAWAKRSTPKRAKADARLALEIAAVHRRSRGTYGSPRVHAELRARGVRVGKKRVERLMRSRGLVARQKRRFRRTTDSRHALPLAPNVLDRQFHASRLGDRRDVHHDRRGLDVPGRDPGPVFAARGRLGRERHQ
jgi:putative transposase